MELSLTSFSDGSSMQISWLVLFRLFLWVLHADESAAGGELEDDALFLLVPRGPVQYSNCREAWCE